MNRKYYIIKYILVLCIIFIATGCQGTVPKEKDFCHIVLEEGEGFHAEEHALTVERGKDAVFELTLEDGYQLEEVKYGSQSYIKKENKASQDIETQVQKEKQGIFEYTVKYDPEGTHLTLTLYDVRYSETIQAAISKSDVVIRYHANGGIRCDGGNAEEEIAIAVVQSHLRSNTAIGTDLFVRKGYTQIGWNTRQDGSGIRIGLGSRVDWEEGMVLYAQWVPWTEASHFQYEIQGEFATITGYQGQEDTLCIPAELEGLTVRRIAKNAFAGALCSRVILPPGIYEVENGAFESSALKELYLYDDISKISDYAFTGCDQFVKLYINAIEPPVYSGNYFDTFSDKYDRLRMLKHQKKIVLFSGSSTRFGYDSALLDEAFEDYEVVNMGVFAYTPALPQLQLILECMGEGDILLHSPEFDASNRQFCSQRSLDYATFAMVESDYDIFSRLDIREFEQVFTAFTAYNTGREGMEKKNYSLSASHYDEDGVPVEENSYNAYGDYCLYRPNSKEEQPIYGLPVHYTVNAFPSSQYIEPLNAVYETFLEKGVQVYFTYSPRNRYALSEESTHEERERLHQYFKENLIVPVISELEDSLVSGVYLYGTDNHLSTEGVEIRTKKIIGELKEQFLTTKSEDDSE